MIGGGAMHCMYHGGNSALSAVAPDAGHMGSSTDNVSNEDELSVGALSLWCLLWLQEK